MQIIKQVDTAQVTFALDDDLSEPNQRLYLDEGTRWLRDSRRRLTRALVYATRALTEPTKVAGAFWEMFHVYLGGETLDPDNGKLVASELNPVLAAIGKTLKGLSGDVTIADLGQMPGVAKLQFKCLHAVCWAKGVPAPQLAGLVFVDIAEMAGRYLKSLWKDPGKGSGFMNPFGSAIHLNFAELLRQGADRGSVVTLIHEGTHKFAQTTDEQYFPDEGASELLDRALDMCRPMISNYQDFEQMLADARKIAYRSGPMHEAYGNVQKMPPEKARNNADGIANFVYEVSELPTTDELTRIIQEVMR